MENIIFCLCLCWYVLPLILSFQLISAKIEPFVWICCTSEVTNERKMYPCLDTFNFANWNQASIASSHSIWKLCKVPSHFLGLYRLQGGLCHCLLLVLVLWASRRHCLRFERPSWFWRTKPWNTVIKHVTVGLYQQGPRVTELSPGWPVVTLGPQRPQNLKKMDLTKKKEDPGWSLCFIIEFELLCTLRWFNTKVSRRSR